MFSARLLRLTLLIVSLLGVTGPAWADLGGTLSMQTDARNRGMSYSSNRPSVQLGLAWDGDAGWYGGVQMAQARFTAGRQGAWLQGYSGRVFAILPGLDAEVGALAHTFHRAGPYDFNEVYAGLLGERWSVRFFHSPDYYGSGNRSAYAEFNLRWPLANGVAAIGHVGVLDGRGGRILSYVGSHGPTRVDLRLGVSWQLGASSDLQLAWVSVSRGGPYIWTDSSRRQTAVLGLTTAF
ncbi:TorF family putative porin [Paucibacter sp. DJ2R-2]|uniref:TorF family putative porin n=1 Tax=Paucibacter sp. DJ2R-2 TaxID=2893558 RepID=UPI0021E3A998|nr:TorF family putative porin [Paucibacter sp. DJ2R-2]